MLVTEVHVRKAVTCVCDDPDDAPHIRCLLWLCFQMSSAVTCCFRPFRTSKQLEVAKLRP